MTSFAITNQIASLVEEIPQSTIRLHGGADNLEFKIHDLIFPTTTTKKRGRPIGSKNKVKDVSEDVPTEPKKRGRPKGVKNKPKDVSEDVLTTPKKRGRPKGSKNKSPIIYEDVPPAPKKRGRPKGSKNKSQ